MLDDILLQVQKPAQYIGQEWNVAKKDFQNSYIKFALCFPDLYEIGMSNLGTRIIYGILNSMPDVSCERFFAGNSDIEQILRKRKIEISSLESKRPLREFDIIGFSLGSELNYTNVLNILELGFLPLQSALRDYSFPLVIGGGPCTLNPEPMHEFFDLFIIGEAEELILELMDIYRKYKEKYKIGKIAKEDLLFIFSQIPGVYVPSLYEVRYAPSGQIETFKPKIEGVADTIKKRIVKDLNTSSFPLEWLVPYIQIVHDRITLEVMRGCPNRCRFCQSKSQYFPARSRGIENILDLAYQTYKRTGYEEISLTGLSVSDYAQIGLLLQGLTGLFKPKAVSISLPSLKAKPVVGGLSCLIATVKKTGLTFAPEAGSERLRKILAKDFDEQGFFQTLKEACACGYRHVKLYFMIGLPCEEREDLDGIVDFASRVSDLGMRVNISINTFIPKPHTPLQWLNMQDLEGIRDKQNYLKGKVKKYLRLNFHNRYMSFLEGVLCRGDRRLSQVIYLVFKNGAKFDAWTNYFAFDKWWRAFKESNIEPGFYLKEKSPDEFLPWDFVDVGIDKATLIREFNKSIAIQKDKRYNEGY